MREYNSGKKQSDRIYLVLQRIVIIKMLSFGGCTCGKCDLYNKLEKIDLQKKSSAYTKSTLVHSMINIVRRNKNY
jgi:hypothetical protein